MPQYTTAQLQTDGNGNPIPQYLDVTDTTDSPQGTFKPINGSAADILIAQEGITVAAGAYESPAPEFTFAGSPYTAYIIGGYTPDAAHSWAVQAGPKFGGDYARALHDVATTTTTRLLQDTRQLIIGESVVFRVSNQDTVDHTYNYYILGLKGV